MNFEEFLEPEASAPVQSENAEAPIENTPSEEDAETTESESIDVQKAVVESLAADKVVQDETIATLRRDNYELQTKIAKLNAKIEEQSVALAKVGDVLAANSEQPLSSSIALLDRNPELNDRFTGESRDQVLEVLKEARDAAEKDGRLRRAQILEAVLCANTPNGLLARRRAELEKLFAENANIVSGPVIERLRALGIPHKNGEEFLLPSEIIKRTY